jgi:DNA polymerase-3 subunit chi
VPRVDFYVTDDASPDARARLACRIVEKAYLAEQRVLVRCASDAALTRIDELLWTFGDGSFVPHEPMPATESAPEAPVALTTGAAPSGAWQVLVNLSHDLPPEWQRFERVAEVLDGDADTRSQARARFRAYREAGSTPETHNVPSSSR